jgi:predicted dehydrogenase
MRHRVLIIGVGSIGERHLRCMLGTGRADVGLCELNDGLRATIADRYGVTAAHGTLDAALAEPWDAAVIATPAPSHVPIATRLAGHGLKLLIEKPLATSTDGVAELVELVESRGPVESRGLVVAVGYVLRAERGLASMRAALQSGRFGRPVQLTLTAGQHFPSYRPAYRDIYYADRRQGGGAIQDAITHYFNAGEWLLGPISRIAVDAAHQVLPGVTVEDTVHVLARHGDVPACYAMNQYQAPNELTLTIVCTGGTLRWELHQQRWRWKDAPDGPAGVVPWHDEEQPPEDRDAWFTRQESAFLDACEGRAAPLCTLRDAWQTLRVNLAALASSDSDGAWQRV